MDDSKNINLCISGWPGSGSTTLALILAVLLKRKYIYIGQVYRHLGKTLGFSDEGAKRPEFDAYIENIIGITTDNYTDFKLLNDENLLLESDIAAFRIGKHPKTFSVFLKTDKSERIKRVVAEKREDAELVLDQRDVMLKQKYLDLWQIDYFDLELIEKKYTLLFDNSNMSLETEVKLILDEIFKIPAFQTISLKEQEELLKQIPGLVERYWAKGKADLIEELKSLGLLMSPEMIMQDMAKIFPEDVSQFPENIRNIFLGLS